MNKTEYGSIDLIDLFENNSSEFFFYIQIVYKIDIYQ